MNQILDAISRDSALWSDFLALCDCGGRRAGTESETKSLDFAEQRLAAIGLEPAFIRSSSHSILD